MAKKDGDPGRLSVNQQAERNADIVAARRRGLSWSQLARTFDLSERHCRTIHAQWREDNPSIRKDDALEIVDYLLEQYQGAAEELAMVAAGADNTSARVGAINARGVYLERIQKLLQETGALPHDLGELRVRLDVEYVARTIWRVMDEHGVPEPVQRELVAALEAGQSQA